MGKSVTISRSTISVLFLLGTIFMYFFAPYSVNTSIAVNLFVGALIIALSLYLGKIKKNRFCLALGIVIYLILITAVAGMTIPYKKEADLGVFLIIVSICIFCASDFHFKSNKHVQFIVVLLDLVVIVWGMAFVLQLDSVTYLTSRIYGASGDQFYYRSILLGKPVLSLRFHGQAGYAYINLFLLNYILSHKPGINKIAKRIMVISQFIFILYSVCLQSNSGYLIALVMGVFLTYHYFQIYGPKVFFVWLPVVLFVGYYLISNDIVSYAIQHATSGEKNGFLGRYSGLYTGNIHIISDYFASGIYTITDYTVKSDSGFIVALTRGNIPFLLAYYYLIWSFLRRNINRKEANLIIAIFLAYEFAYTFLIGRYQGLYWMIIYKICLDSCQFNN